MTGVPLHPDELGRRLAQIYDLVGPLYRRAYRTVEDDVAPEGLSVGVRAVLVLLHAGGPLTVPQMGRAQALSRQFVQRMVNDATTQDLVEAIANPAHRRSSLIRLTDHGTTIITAVLAREHAVLSRGGRRPHRRRHRRLHARADPHAGLPRRRGPRMSCARSTAVRRRRCRAGAAQEPRLTSSENRVCGAAAVRPNTEALPDHKDSPS